MTLREALDGLEKHDRARLMYAFDEMMPQYIVLPDDMFIGVFCEHLEHLDTLQEAGDWSYGRIARPGQQPEALQPVDS